MLKKVFAIVLALIVVISLVGCTTTSNDSTTKIVEFTATVTKLDVFCAYEALFIAGVVSEYFSGVVTITSEQYACLNIGDTVTIIEEGGLVRIKEFNSENVAFRPLSFACDKKDSSSN